MTIEIKIKDLRKAERGTHTGPVQVTREGKTFVQQRRVGRKDTGKIASLPQELKDEILTLRRQNDSGAKIKTAIETMIKNRMGKLSLGKEFEAKRHELTNKYDTATKAGDKEEMKRLWSEIKSMTDKEEKFTDSPEFKSGAVTKDGKLTITGQALVSWAQSRGVTGKTRKTVAQVAAEKDKEWTERWNKLNKEKARLEIELKESENNATAQRTQKLRIQDRLENCQNRLSQAKNK